MTNHGDGDKALWLTEFGFTTCTGQETAGCVSETRQGEYLGRAIELARAWPFVRAMFVYTLRDISAGRIDQAGGYGLVDRDFGPRPSYFAVRDEFAAAARSATSRGAESVGDLARVP
jgi:hypothetical protein